MSAGVLEQVCKYLKNNLKPSSILNIFY